jgi:hypothetical protein
MIHELEYIRKEPSWPNRGLSSSPVLLLGLGLPFSFLILYTVGRTPWTGDQPFARPLPTDRITQVPPLGFESTSQCWSE